MEVYGQDMTAAFEEFDFAWCQVAARQPYVAGHVPAVLLFVNYRLKLINPEGLSKVMLESESMADLVLLTLAGLAVSAVPLRAIRRLPGELLARRPSLRRRWMQRV